MEIDSLREGFDRVAEKRALSSAKTLEAVDQLVNEVEQAIVKLQMMNTDSTGNVDHSSILTELKIKVNEMAPLNQLENNQKELNVALSKYLKLLEKSFNPDIAKAYRNVDFEVHTVNNIIANHFYRQGLFDLGDMFVHECGASDEASLKLPFQEMYAILEAMKVRNLEPALSWAATNHDQLLQNGSMLEFKLYQLQFVEILSKGSGDEAKDEAIVYARTHLVPFASVHKEEFQKLMACLLWAGRLDQSHILSYCHQRIGRS